MKLLLFACFVAASAMSVVAAPWVGLPPGGCATGQCPVAVPPAPPIDTPTLPAGIRSAVVRIVHTQGASRALGSGTLVDVDAQQGLVVTCAHLFRDGTGSIQVVFPDGRAVDAQLLRVDQRADLAALAVAALQQQPVKVAEQYPRRGDPLTSCGYGSDGRLWCNRGQALGYVANSGSKSVEVLELSGTARFGDSGGPVFDGDYQLVAVLFGTNGRVVDGTFCGRVRKFLSGLSPRFTESPAVGPPSAPPDAAAAALAAPPAPSDNQPPPAESDRLARLEGLVARLHDAWQGIGGRVDRLADAVKSVKESLAGARGAEDPATPNVELPADASPLDPIAEAARPWLSAKLTTVLISLGVPGGIAGVAAGAAVYLIMQRGKRRLQERLDRMTQSAASTVAASAMAEAPANQAVVRHHNRYVPFEVTAMDKAWASAHAHIGEKYPGAVPYLKMAEGVKDQLLSGIGDPTISEGGDSQ